MPSAAAHGIKCFNVSLTIYPTAIPNRKVIIMLKYDIFISHASEDKEYVARPLAIKLSELGLKIWLDEFELTLGDSLRRKIDHGLAESRFGVVILSNSFFSKEWPQKELDALIAREDGDQKVILPIWHNLSKKEVHKYSPLLADKLAASTADGINIVARLIKETVDKNNNSAIALAKNERHIVKAVSTNLSVVAYRVLCLIYTYNILNKTFSNNKIKIIYKIINEDIKSKIKIIQGFSNQLTDEERSSLAILKQNSQSLTMRDRNLDSLFDSISKNLIYFLQKIPNLSFHKDDKDWYTIKENKVEFIKESNAFSLFLHELNEYDNGEIKKNPKYAKCSDDLIKNHIDYSEYFLQLIAKKVIQNISEQNQRLTNTSTTDAVTARDS